MSGTYAIEKFLGGHVNDDLYFSSPLRFLPGLEGPSLDVLRTRMVVLASGSGRWEDVGESLAVAHVLGSKGIPNRVDDWAPPTTTTGRRGGRCSRSTSTTCSRDGTTLPAAHLPRRRHAGGAGTGGVPAADGLGADAVVHVRLEEGPVLPLDVTAYAGVVLGGSPFTVSEPDSAKSATERRVEGELTVLVRELVARQVPFLGLCYGVGATSLALGGVVDRTYGEPVGTTTVRVTAAGRDDLLFGSLPEVFAAFVGHKEGGHGAAAGRRRRRDERRVPGAGVPGRAVRLGHAVPSELEAEAFVQRIRAYAHLGYFRPDEQDAIIDVVRAADATAAHDVLRRFVAEFA